MDFTDNLKIICLNGPPRSGKDTIGEMMCLHLNKMKNGFGERPYVVSFKFSALLKMEVHRMLGLEDTSHDRFENSKDTRLPEFFNATPREAYINYSEGFIKPTFGAEFWSVKAWEVLQAILGRPASASRPLFVVITDMGFQTEIDYLKSRVRDLDDLALVRLYRDGCDFSKDSRNYVWSDNGEHKTHHAKIHGAKIYNNASLEQLRQNAELNIDNLLSSFTNPVFNTLRVSDPELP